jgi:integrase
MKSRTRPLPPHLKRYFDQRDGKVYLYFRKRGHKTVRLPGPIGSDEFWTAYNAALKGKLAIGEARNAAGSVSAALAAYYASKWWDPGLSPGTRALRRPLLERRIRVPYGQRPLKQITANFVEALLESLPPHAARNLKKALRGFLKHAKHDVTRDIELPPAESTPHATWTAAAMAQYEAAHAIGTNARLAFALAKGTGAGRTEITRMGPQHIEQTPDGPAIRIKRQKTGKESLVLLDPELLAIIAATPLTGLQTFLTTKTGKPYRPADLSDEFKVWCRQAGTDPKFTLHGLRHRMGKTLADHGVQPHGIAAVLGHANVRSALHYSQAYDRDQAGLAAMNKLRMAEPVEPFRTDGLSNKKSTTKHPEVSGKQPNPDTLKRKSV